MITNKTKNLFLDDFREPLNCVSYMSARIGAQSSVYSTEDWDIVRDYNEFVKWIEINGIPDMVSFDHDLADDHYDPAMCGDGEDYPTEFKEKTGLDCAIYLVEYCNKNQSKFPKHFIHSMNPVGSDRIKNYIEYFIKK
jgi:hypothetical protein